MRDPYRVLERFGFRPSQVALRPLGTAGGMSGATFWQVSIESQLMCLRCWPGEHPSRPQLEWIHQQMRRARAAGCRFVPELRASNDDSTIVAHSKHLWELSSWQPGWADYHERPSTAKLVSGLRGLAQFHLAVAGSPLDRIATSAGLQDRWRRLDRLTPQRLEELHDRISRVHGHELATLARAVLTSIPGGLERARAICRTVKDQPTRLQPCLRDVWHDHLLFTGDELTGLVDFGAMRIETPVADLARLLGSLARNDAPQWQTGLQAYRQIGRLSEDEFRLLAAFDAANIVLSGLNWIRWLYIERRAFEARDRVTGRMAEIAVRAQQFSEDVWPFRDQL